MSTNDRWKDGESGVWSNVTPTNVEGGGSPASGLFCLVGQKPGVCLNDAGDGGNDAGACDVAIRNTFDLEVTAPVGGVAYGDELFYNTGSDILDTVGTVHFGYARGTLGASATGTIPVSVGY